jgi:hypothetical protein
VIVPLLINWKSHRAIIGLEHRWDESVATSHRELYHLASKSFGSVD